MLGVRGKGVAIGFELLNERYEVVIDPAIAERARAAVQRMIDLPPPAAPTRYDLVKARHHVDVELI